MTTRKNGEIEISPNERSSEVVEKDEGKKTVIKEKILFFF